MTTVLIIDISVSVADQPCHSKGLLRWAGSFEVLHFLICCCFSMLINNLLVQIYNLPRDDPG